MNISVLLVDDHTLVREAVAGLLRAQPGITVVGQAGSLASGEAAVVATELLNKPRAVAVVDVTMADGSGLALVRSLRARSDRIGLVVLTMHDDDATLLEALESGASALVRKSDPVEEIISAVVRAAASPRAFSAIGLADALKRRSAAPTASALTQREREVLELLASGASVAQVGTELFMSPSTVKTHISKIYHKLGAHNRASAVMAAVQLGLVRRPPPGT